MGQIKVSETGIDGLLVIEPTIHGDERGYFMETYNLRDMQEAGLDMVFVQDNQSMSVRGVLRGLHFQKQFPQGKLVRVLRGEVYDVAVDLRKGSATFGKWHGVILSEKNKKQFYIDKGFAHGFLVLSETAEFVYKVTDFYRPGDEGGLAWNDPQIGIEWPGVRGIYRGSADCSGYTLQDGTPLILSEKDKKWGGLSDTFLFQRQFSTDNFRGFSER
ncbi:MAG: dTDP-4-dehydrorhamnose 3,5-epimerase [Eubacteriales bacterium]|nr:dTDP-4-dehydrorhamnose 3,5-epimerase [Eubacteriales bacterium]